MDSWANAEPVLVDLRRGTTHRIDPAAVKAEVLAAAFVLDGESDILRNPKDVYTDRVFDGAVQGHTDQFILRFKKPK